MAVQVSYPGVYIDEFTPAAPIQGVGTSTAAFIGLCKYGPPDKPTLITSWDAFVKIFTSGDPIGDPPDDDDYLWYAVKGFFQNGGKVCYIIAVSNAKPDWFELTDETTPNASKTIRVEARFRGISDPLIRVSVTPTHAVKSYDSATEPEGARLFAPSVSNATVANNNLSKIIMASAADAVNFVASDQLKIDGGGNTELPTITRVSGTDVFLAAALSHAYANATVTLAPLPTAAPLARTFRVQGDDAARLVPGCIVTISQDPAHGGPANAPPATVVTKVVRQRLTPTLTTYLVSVTDGLDGYTLYGANIAPITLQSEEFDLTVSGMAQPYTGLSMSPTHSRYYASIVNADPNGTIFANPVEPPNTSALPKNRPKTPAGGQQLTPGANFNADIIKGRTSDYEAALALLEPIADVSIVTTPDRTDSPVQAAVLDHCYRLYDRFAIFDAPKNTALADVENHRNGLENGNGFGALYYPWIQVTSAMTGKPIMVPPSGHVAGVYARTDNTRGVFKAPAGTEAIINGALGVEQMFSNADQGVINMKGINVIRVFQSGGRPIVWGARTTSADTNWQYVNIRRLFLFLEESIQQGIRGSVFEPNNTSLWKKLNRTITAFLTQQWRDGALFGNTVEEAFYVRIDEGLNPDSERALGRLNIEIGIRPSYPAEFIVVRIGIWQGGSSVSEA